MKAKTIKSILRRKILHWAESVEDQEIKKLILENTIVTGGAIVSMLLNEPVNDYDVYFRDPISLFKVTEYYLKKFKETSSVSHKGGIASSCNMYLWGGGQGDKGGIELKSIEDWKLVLSKNPEERLRIVIRSAGVAVEGHTDDYQYFEGQEQEAGGAYVEELFEKKEEKKTKDKDEKSSYRPIFMTSNAISLSDDIQIVVRFYGDVQKIHENYDYLHCTNAWTSWDGQLKFGDGALECILNRELRYVGSRYPLCSLFRMRKFLKRGWQINVGQILKMAFQVQTLNLKDPWILEDQLIGVDQAYFRQIIDLIMKRVEETKSETVDYAYVVELIDRIF